ncbi:MAG: GNAT family N-acetyltransferase [Oscillospiraceae bacterium]|nr:GNAT family N-acetyltransferase [Oscillospiraceae bacterium]
MDYTIRHVTSERELDAALAFDEKVFGVPSEGHSPAYSREKWLERMKGHGDLMLYAQLGGEVIGIVFGRMEEDGSVTVGPVAADRRYRQQGVARALMRLLEKRARRQGVRRLTLGAVESAEGFYAKLGYTGTLLVQSEAHSIKEILALNDKYPVIRTGVYQGKVNQVYFRLPAPDRAFQRKYESSLPGCGTQMVFSKTL